MIVWATVNASGHDNSTHPLVDAAQVKNQDAVQHSKRDLKTVHNASK
jgi:hypothetical protein